MKISVLIPVYNVENYIERCIKSILNQSLQDFEVIIVNDATPDNSIVVAKKIVGDDSRFIFIDNPRNMGLMRTRANAYKLAKGEYIVFCDSDDWLQPNCLEILYNAAALNAADIVVAQSQSVNDSYILKSCFINMLPYGADKFGVYKALLNDKLSHSLWAKIYRTELFKKELLCYDNFVNSEDGILFYQIVSRAEKFVLINDVVYNYYQNVESSTHKRLADKQIKNIVQFWNSIPENISFSGELMKLYGERVCRKMLSLIVAGYDENIILDSLVKREVLKIINFKFILNEYGYIKAFFVYLLYKSQSFRVLFKKFINRKYAS